MSGIPSDDDLRREIAGFEAARIDHPVQLTPRSFQRLLVVHDGSDQDATAGHLAAAIARPGCDTRVLQLQPADDAAVILAAAEHRDLIIAPCPLRADYASVGTVSLTTDLDLLLVRARVPVMLVRGALADASTVVRNPLVVLQVHRHRKVEAAAAAVGLAAGGGCVALLSIVDPGHEVHAAEFLGRHLSAADLAPDTLAALAGARAAALSAALQRHAEAWQITPQVELGVGALIDTALEVARRRQSLLVCGLDRSGPTEAAMLARRLILASELPVLLV